MRLAVLADVHANLPALRAVLDDLAQRRVDRIAVLGDLVGYGAQPEECIELLRSHDAHGVIGNHDLGVLGEPQPFQSQAAEQVQVWTRRRLSARSVELLRGLPRRRTEAWGSMVHGCFINQTHATGYVTPTTAELNLSWLEEHVTPPHLALFGHTHMPAAYSRAWRDVTAAAIGRVALPRDHVALINPGAVGQPRDRDPRAAYACLDLDGWEIEFHRVDYDVAASVTAIRAAGFHDSLAARLFTGT